MNTEEFIYHVLENFALILVCLFISFIIYYCVFRKVICSFFDPLALQLIGSSFAFSVMLFMFFLSLVEAVYFCQYLLTQIAYWIGIFSFKQTDLIHTKTPIVRVKNNLLLTEVIFFVAAASYLIIQLITYSVLGIPLFASERLSLYADSGGLGILGRFSDSLAMAACFSSFCLFYFSEKFKKVVYIFLILYFVTLLLTGAKSSVLSIFTCLFLFSAVSHKLYISKRKEIIAFCLVAFLGIFILFFSEDSFSAALAQYTVRLLGFGDVFWQGYNSEIINSINEPSAFAVLFRDFLGVFRLVSWTDLPIPIGRQIFSMLYWDANMGPNMRHNILGYILFGFGGSIFFSYLLGWLVGFVRCNLYDKFKNPGLLGIIYFLFYSLMVVVETDVALAMGKLLDFLLTGVFFFPLVLFLYYCIVKNEK